MNDHVLVSVLRLLLLVSFVRQTFVLCRACNFLIIDFFDFFFMITLEILQFPVHLAVQLVEINVNAFCKSNDRLLFSLNIEDLLVDCLNVLRHAIVANNVLRNVLLKIFMDQVRFDRRYRSRRCFAPNLFNIFALP